MKQFYIFDVISYSNSYNLNRFEKFYKKLEDQLPFLFNKNENLKQFVLKLIYLIGVNRRLAEKKDGEDYLIVSQ